MDLYTETTGVLGSEKKQLEGKKKKKAPPPVAVPPAAMVAFPPYCMPLQYVFRFLQKQAWGSQPLPARAQSKSPYMELNLHSPASSDLASLSRGQAGSWDTEEHL